MTKARVALLIDPNKLPKNLVPHPRFGTKVHRAGDGIDERQIRRSFYLLKDSLIYPPSAMRADVSKQGSSLGARPFYVDILQDCRTCRRPFIFYAVEQQSSGTKRWGCTQMRSVSSVRSAGRLTDPFAQRPGVLTR